MVATDTALNLNANASLLEEAKGKGRVSANLLEKVDENVVENHR